MPKRILLASCFLFTSINVYSEVLFQGDWKNFIPYFYDNTSGWKNLNRDYWGQPTGDIGWDDFMSYQKSKRTPHTWEINTSFARDRISLEIDPQSPKGDYVAKFTVKSGDHRQGKFSGERSEMATMLDKSGDKLNVTKDSGHEVYGISIKVPEDWAPPQKDPNKGGNMWSIFMQLHSPNIFNSPPALDLSVDTSYALRMNAGELYEFVTNTKTGEQIKRKKDCVRYDLKDGSLRKGQWVQFLMDVNWSESNNGFVKLYRRDQNESYFKLVLSLTNIATLQTSKYIKTDLASCPSCTAVNTAHYWRVGYYRSTSESLKSTLWLGSVVRGTTLNEVAVAAFGAESALFE